MLGLCVGRVRATLGATIFKIVSKFRGYTVVLRSRRLHYYLPLSSATYTQIVENQLLKDFTIPNIPI